MGELDHAGTDVDIWPDGPPSEDVAKALTVALRDAGWRIEYGA